MALDLCAASATFAFVLIGAVNALVRAEAGQRELGALMCPKLPASACNNVDGKNEQQAAADVREIPVNDFYTKNEAADLALRNPITGISACCARTVAELRPHRRVNW